MISRIFFIFLCVLGENLLLNCGASGKVVTAEKTTSHVSGQLLNYTSTSLQTLSSSSLRTTTAKGISADSKKWIIGGTFIGFVAVLVAVVVVFLFFHYRQRDGDDGGKDPIMEMESRKQYTNETQ